jgi:hypothetical protein
VTPFFFFLCVNVCVKVVMMTMTVVTAAVLCSFFSFSVVSRCCDGCSLLCFSILFSCPGGEGRGS